MHDIKPEKYLPMHLGMYIHTEKYRRVVQLEVVPDVQVRASRVTSDGKMEATDRV